MVNQKSKMVNEITSTPNSGAHDKFGRAHGRVRLMKVALLAACVVFLANAGVRAQTVQNLVEAIETYKSGHGNGFFVNKAHKPASQQKDEPVKKPQNVSEPISIVFFKDAFASGAASGDAFANGADADAADDNAAANTRAAIAYTNPVSAGGVLWIEAADEVDEKLLNGAIIEIYSVASGRRVDRILCTGRLTPTTMKYGTGIFILVLKGKDGLQVEMKVTVN